MSSHRWRIGHRSKKGETTCWESKVRALNGGRCPWGGRKKGVRVKLTKEKEAAIRSMKERGTPIAQITRAVGVARNTVYSVITGSHEQDRSDHESSRVNLFLLCESRENG